MDDGVSSAKYGLTRTAYFVAAIAIPALLFLLAPALFRRLLHPCPWAGFTVGVVTFLTQPAVSMKDLVANRADRRSALLIFLALTAAQLFAVLVFCLYPDRETNVLSATVIAGVFGAVAGLVLRLWSIRTLGQYFSTIVALRPEHQLIERGPYRLLRHPAYLGTFISTVGVALCLAGAKGVVVALALTLPAYLNRMRIEERAMIEALGPAYLSYLRRSYRLVPFLY
jgi:protein-S-isoprenylcysteine O-methyltransferase